MAMYRALSEIPLPTAAQFINDDVVNLEFTIRDNNRDVKRNVSTSIFLGADSDSVSTPALDVGDIVASISAPSGTTCFPRRAVLRETTGKKKFVEIWIGNVLEVSKDVSDVHDSFYSDEFFSTLSFSPSEFAFMYVAESKEPTEAREKFKFTPHLGEGLAGKRRPTIYVYCWDPSTIPCSAHLASVSPALHHDNPVLFGQAVFSPLDKSTIYATGYEFTRDGRLLGVRWCYNRPSGIWEIKLPSLDGQTSGANDDGAPVLLQCPSRKLTPAHLSCRSARIYYDSTAGAAKLFWLSHASSGPHAGTFSLHSWDPATPDAPSKLLVDTVWEPRASDGFPGLYIDANLPLSPFVRVGEEVGLIFDSAWGSRTTVLFVSAMDGTVKDLTPDSDGKLFSWSVLATDGRERLVCTRSSPTIPHEILLGQVNGHEVSWKVIHAPYISSSVKTALSRLEYSVIPIPDRGRTETVIIRASSSNTIPPCIQFIHGGPHGVATTAFSPIIAFIVIEGYTVSLPNYMGSTGFGENSVRALLGNCGTLDFQDCKGKQFYFNEWKIEYPIYSSPEGYPTSSEGPHPLPPRRTPEESQRIFKTSPIAYVDAVRAHVLLHLGGSDLRVTPTHGLEYYHALKGNARNLRPGQDIEMHWFEKEGHSLDGVEVNRIVWETSLDWLNKYRV
ncbi:Alpha/Beta hydrolase protein [Mycena galericulata]|nr:Alpha/Beta hydrolase protein [Mycena galericulata]